VTATPFVHLHVHTEFSLLDSTVRIPQLMQHCVADGMPAIAMTDLNNLFGMVKFYKKAVAAGIKPIIGVDLRIVNDDEPDRPFHLVLLCQNMFGYRNLTRLVSRCYLEGQVRGEPRARREWLDQERCAGLIALSGGLHGDVGRALSNGHEAAAKVLLAAWRETFGDRYYLELIRTGRPGEEDCVRTSIKLARAEGVAVVASNDVRFISRDDFNAHEARVCIREGRGLADPDRPRNYSDNQYLRSSAKMTELFADAPAAIENATEIARRCNLDLELGGSALPAFPIPAGQTEAQYLAADAERGLRAKLEEIYRLQEIPEAERADFSAPYAERLRTELEVIGGMGFPGYFLLVADFIRWARENDIPVGPGRGSGAGSLVAWGGGITDIDRLQHGVLWERCLSR
jgi:DNA polymerase-3 subunit alpha